MGGTAMSACPPAPLVARTALDTSERILHSQQAQVVGVELPAADRDNVLVPPPGGGWTMRCVAVVFILAVLVEGCSAGGSERPVHTATQPNVEAGMKLSSPVPHNVWLESRDFRPLVGIM